jgi:hypothetical protein
MTFGQQDFEEGAEEKIYYFLKYKYLISLKIILFPNNSLDEAERPAFLGVSQRSITNDDLNEKYDSPFKRKMKILLSVIVSFMIIAFVILTVIYIFEFKQNLIYCVRLGGCSYLNNSLLNYNTLPAVVNSVQIGIFNFIYNSLKDLFNDFENHKILSSYENSLIFKVFLFQFFNLFNSCFFIAFLSGYFPALELCRYNPNEAVPENCFTQLRN